MDVRHLGVLSSRMWASKHGGGKPALHLATELVERAAVVIQSCARAVCPRQPLPAAAIPRRTDSKI